MQDTMFIGLDGHKATISVALAQGKRGGELRHWGTIPPPESVGLPRSWAALAGSCLGSGGDLTAS